MKLKLWMTLSIGIGLLVLNDGAYLAYDQYIRPKLNDQVVWEAQRNIAVNQIIQASDLVKMHVPRGQVEPGAITNASFIVGKMAAEPFVPHEQFIATALESNPYVLGRNEQNIALNPTWVANLPQGLRRGDRVDISLLLPQGTTAQKITDTAFIQNIATHTPILTDKLVEYVRNNGNQEVVNVGPTPNQPPQGGGLAAAENGSSVPNAVELKLPDKDWALLQQAIQDGYQLAIAYTPN
ncbi:CpaB family protein [Alicyclobacillus mengziensis]|uniref:SAF domain-containing protein n=1 Tax=Alicyclobacillus mengziensis TaxID=2931921 RepID=A0A9X7W3S9_9BACL|nr:SAF domain-containing protein [Alicyclobacillus mengziensis]QSO50136.1 SAF domain-containing protein [Alicyclobacillus mengziensis]